MTIWVTDFACMNGSSAVLLWIRAMIVYISMHGMHCLLRMHATSLTFVVFSVAMVSQQCICWANFAQTSAVLIRQHEPDSYVCILQIC